MIDHVFNRAHGICALQKLRVCRLQVGITWKSKAFILGQIGVLFIAVTVTVKAVWRAAECSLEIDFFSACFAFLLRFIWLRMI